jgi:hypothetical protein
LFDPRRPRLDALAYLYDKAFGEGVFFLDPDPVSSLQVRVASTRDLCIVAVRIEGSEIT